MKRILLREVAELYPGYFALVMATGIVSIAAHILHAPAIAWLLLGINLVAYPILWLLTLARLVWFFPRVASDLADHGRGPGFFTLVAGTSVLGKQLELVTGATGAAIALWVLAVPLWFLLSYAFLTAVTVRTTKPLLATGLHGGWLTIVVATQSITVLGVLAAQHAGSLREPALFFTLSTHLVGCVLYVVIISLIFYRFTFMPLEAHALTPPYWINMGALAITTLAGATLIQHAPESSLLRELLPFLKGTALLSWATATWWIPLLVILGAWRHLRMRVPLVYDPQYWGLVFPLGMYTAATFQMAGSIGLPYLDPVARYFLYVAYAAWAVTFVGLLRRIWSTLGPRKELLPGTAVPVAGESTPPPVSFRVICPVHGVEARVQLLGMAGNEPPRLGECSLGPGHGAVPACQGRCIELAAEAESEGGSRAASLHDQDQAGVRSA